MLKVLDTNIILLSAENLFTLSKDGSIIVLPETVIDEIDSKKSVIGEIGFQAREFGRLLSRATRLKEPRKIGKLTITPLKLESTTIYVASTESYPSIPGAAPNIINDRKIIYIAECLREAKEECIFVSNDVMCLLRAESLGLSTTDVKDVDNTIFTFVKEHTVAPELFGLIHDNPILSIDPEYLPENYNYKFICAESGQIKLGTINNGKVEILGKVTEKELRQQEINPINAEQLFLSKAIQDPSIEIVVCEALAGSGKTSVSISNAIKMVGKNSPYEGILYIRASVDDVDKAEEVGFLPGMEEKFAPYLHPVEDTLDFMARNRLKAKKLKGEELEDAVEVMKASMKAKYNIQAMTTLGMRGRTFTDCIAIIDEAQNMSKASLQKVLTRFGKNVKVIIIGSNRQIDNAYITKYTNGLSAILDACTKPSVTVKTYAVTLTKVVRSQIAEWAEALFSKGNKE